jgi:hypothetical protein
MVPAPYKKHQNDDVHTQDLNLVQNNIFRIGCVKIETRQSQQIQ